MSGSAARSANPLSTGGPRNARAPSPVRIEPRSAIRSSFPRTARVAVPGCGAQATAGRRSVASTTLAAARLGVSPSGRIVARPSVPGRRAGLPVPGRREGEGSTRAARFSASILPGRIRHRVPVEDQVWQHDARHLDQPPGDELLDARDLVGHHGRDAGQREFEGHGARGGEGRLARPGTRRVSRALAATIRTGTSQPFANSSIRSRWRETAGRIASISTCFARRASVGPKTGMSRSISERREPGRTTRGKGVRSRRASDAASGRNRRGARSADGRHTYNPVHPDADAPRVRRAAGRGRDR